jgi:DNA-binding MarR family transcriptional regulator
VSDLSTNPTNELHLLEALEVAPETTQADLAAQLGVAVGTVNWYLKRWAHKGYVKIRRINRWRWSYLLTPEGMAHKAHLAGQYVEASMSLYRRTRAQARRLLSEAKAAGYDQVVVNGHGEIADICRLTSLEMQMSCVADTNDRLPVIRVDGVNLSLAWPDAPQSNISAH